MPKHKPYRDARIEMFENYPPDFYYGNCRADYYLPVNKIGMYKKIKSLAGGKSCMYIKSDAIKTVSPSQKKEIEALGYGF